MKGKARDDKLPRKRAEDNDLPVGIQAVYDKETGDKIGYRVKTDDKKHAFTAKNMTNEQQLQMAKDYLSGKIKIARGQQSGRQRTKNSDYHMLPGLAVKNGGFKVKFNQQSPEKSFTNRQKYEQKELYDMAVAYWAEMYEKVNGMKPTPELLGKDQDVEEDTENEDPDNSNQDDNSDGDDGDEEDDVVDLDKLDEIISSEQTVKRSLRRKL